MNLTIDIGNTSTKVLIFLDTNPVFRKEVRFLSVTEINAILKNYPIEHCMVASVTGENKGLLKALAKIPGFSSLSSSTRIPIKNFYKTPHTLGNDRLANAVAASFLFPAKNVLIIDMGTCIKYDFINKRKQFLGGGISPGIDMRFRAMHDFTGRLPKVKFAGNVNLVGKSTVEAMQSGVTNGISEEIMGIVSRYQKSFKPLKVILTGGDARRFAGDLNLSIFAASDLVNIGLNEILRFNS